MSLNSSDSIRREYRLANYAAFKFFLVKSKGVIGEISLANYHLYSTQ